MKNWLEQDIVPGAVVYRGARQGDSSNFRVGIVDEVNSEKETVKVVWFLGHEGVSSVGLGTLVLIDIEKDYLYKKATESLEKKNKRLAELRLEHPDLDYWRDDLLPWW